MLDDAHFMRMAIRLARRGLGRTSPNPSVGAVVVRGGRVVGRGYTAPAGGPHAEVRALQQAGRRARGATLYVTLEPCAHFGRTPPCVDAVRAAGVARVVVGSRDPNPSVAGDGAAKLRRGGIAVVVGVERATCDELIAAFRKHVASGLPLVTVKLAASLDGRIATRTGASKWITGERARAVVQQLRNEHDAVLVGIETIVRDDPALTCRMRGGRDPLRVVLDSRLRIPLRARVLTNEMAAGTVVATALRGGAKAGRLRRRGAQLVCVPRNADGLSLRHVLQWLGRRGLMSVLVEGGAAVVSSALRARLVDRMVLFYAPKLIGGDGRAMIDALGVAAMNDVVALDGMRVRRVGEDLIVTAQPRYSVKRG
ncbi:MAG TPA: bifunctional diaminohydroxyphosphoribosylaminopyrimidine deaminase/5-amino-6-(5-phosphoribosylamino)uracil reductase RibD [Candidatus Kryptonia bacterium]|nr:bifunctional diaminohydroxyphosphoribosylaminopyrimidine deaminase/5-amino-6-(5-phosphoribosylamino)uracil reductase RibD [Candidatus Kryptonia bacterium]